ncbi:MAG TPA: UTP--glucose-1-phosphate uridylyltransferase, partial [Candidatus Binatia bacterium]|nr:UTP--glucose-1-phosphate uridylyltransferase [Candidatus Binatia bacterium]
MMMMYPSDLVQIITATDPAQRDQSLGSACAGFSLDELLHQCAQLDAFRRRSENLYERVRALFFLYAIHRFHLPSKLLNGSPVSGEASRITEHAAGSRSLIPFQGYQHLLQRRFEEAIDHFLKAQETEGPSDAISSALAAAYYRLAFQTLADQVRRCVRSVRGNQWMFRVGHPNDQPLRLRPELLRPNPADGTCPILRECTPVRMDLTHCGWSDIFFLGMDFPEGAKVLNISIDLAIHGRDAAPRPPVEAYLRVIEEPLLRLVSVDLGASADITNLAEVFDFAKDYLGLLKAALIAAGVVPPGVEGSGQNLAELLARMAGPGRGLELVSSVNNIPKGSRLAVSTTLLAALVSVCMRATGQAASLTGPLQEHERRLVLARALLGEWLGGSGGGWQDSGGVWPGMKLIEGVLAADGEPEYGVSRGRLMPQHRILTEDDASAETRRKLQDSLVLVHGGMAQNVGPILEMVTEKYLLRSEKEWQARQSMLGILEEILAGLRQGSVQSIGAATTRNFRQPIQTIIPWASNFFTETLIERVRAEFGGAFWGFWMLGGMSGGGMGFIFAPEKKALAQQRLQQIMSETKRELEQALPFAMEPVVYDFAINERGSFADLLPETSALMPPAYYTLIVPELLRQDRHSLSPLRRAELDKFGAACRTKPELRGVVQTLFDVMLPRGKAETSNEPSLAALLEQHGFDRVQHERIRADLKDGRIGLAQNRLPASAVIENVRTGDVKEPAQAETAELESIGRAALERGELAIVTLAAGAGSRWT